MILVNGRETDTIDAQDRGLQYGDGLFETIAVVGGRPRFWDAHMARLSDGCRRIGLPVPDRGTLADEARRVLGHRHRAVLKILLSRGPGGRGYRAPQTPAPTRILSASSMPDHPADFYHRGIRVRLCETRLGHTPALAGLKHLNRLEQVLARSEWTDPHIAEGLMLDVDGYVVEGTMTNVFVRRGQVLQTPPVDRCGVAGVMRNWVLGRSAEFGLQVEVTPLTLQGLREAEEVFLTNAVVGIWPVRRFEQVQYRKAKTAGRLLEWLREEADA